MQAIETQYNGYRFRSRLEARWAVFFDALGVEWEYEKEGYELGGAGRYLPDFWLPQLRVWVEIKPTDVEYNSSDYRKIRALSAEERPVFLVSGNIGNEGITIFAQDSCDSGGGWYENDECYWAIYHNRLILAIPDYRIDSDRTILDGNWDSVDCIACANDSLLRSRLTNKMKQAYVIARSARFEHGETPRVLRGRQSR